MNPREKTLKELQEFTNKELIQKKYYELRNDPVALKQYAAEIEDTVREQHILLFDFPFVHHPDLLRESDLYPHLSISHVSNVNVVRHLRYTPVFEHSHSFFTVLYVLSGQCGHTVNGIDVPMAEGDVFFLPPYAKQTISVFDDSIVLNIHIRRDTFGDYLMISTAGVYSTIWFQFCLPPFYEATQTALNTLERMPVISCAASV